MGKYTEMLEKYRELNKISEKGAAVFFGADRFCEIPFAELARDAGTEIKVYNRSLKGMTVNDSEEAAEICILELMPQKIFINIGENDIDTDGGEFEEKYEWLLYTAYSKCKCDIYILSVTNDKTGKINERLKRIAEKCGCEYIDISGCRTSFKRLFSKIIFFLRCSPISFYDAMSYR